MVTRASYTVFEVSPKMRRLAQLALAAGGAEKVSGCQELPEIAVESPDNLCYNSRLHRAFRRFGRDWQANIAGARTVHVRIAWFRRRWTNRLRVAVETQRSQSLNGNQFLRGY